MGPGFRQDDGGVRQNNAMVAIQDEALIALPRFAPMEIFLNCLSHFSTRITVSLIIACLSVLPAAAQTALADWKQQDLLQGRLSIRTPPDAKAQGPALSNIMGTAPSAASKTRIRVPVSGTEIVVQAKSLKALAPRDMAAAIKSTEYFSKYEGEKQELTLDLGGGWSALAVIPKQYKYWDDSYLLAYAWIKSPNAMLYELVLATWADTDAYSKLSQAATDIVRSLQGGNASGEIPAGTTVLDSQGALGDEQEMVVDLDGKYVIETEAGIDFVVNRISQLVEIDTDGGQMGFYLGDYPQFNREAELKSGASIVSDPEKIFGRTPEWLVRNRGNLKKQSTVLDVRPGSGLKCHLFITGTPQQVDALVKVAHSLRLRPKS
jgi:hypothetical protein